jgi:hypothetical protein
MSLLEKYLVLKNQIGLGIYDLIDLIDNNTVTFEENQIDTTVSVYSPSLYLKYNINKSGMFISSNSYEIINTDIIYISNKSFRISIDRVGTIFLTNTYFKNSEFISKLKDNGERDPRLTEKIMNIRLTEHLDNIGKDYHVGIKDIIDGGHILKIYEPLNLTIYDKTNSVKFNGWKKKIIFNGVDIFFYTDEIGNVYVYVVLNKSKCKKN